MKILTTPFYLFLLLFANTMYSQDILWEKSYGGLHADYLMDAQPTADYGFILAGSSLSKKTGNKSQDNKGALDYSIWKIDESGQMEWQKNFGGAGSDLLQSVALTNDGGFILAGVSSSNKGLDKKEDSRGGDDFWIIKLNAKGGEEWQATIGGDSQEKLSSIKQTRDGGYIIAGTSSSWKSSEKSQDGFGNLDYWVVKLDRKGKIHWQKTFGGRYADELRSIDTTFDGGYILGGYSNSPSSGNKLQDNMGPGDYWVIKLDDKGDEQWQKTIGGTGDDQLFAVKQTYDKGYILAGNSDSQTGQYKTKSNGNGTDFWVVKLDDTGVIVWQETYNFGKYDILTSIIENEDHSLLMAGFAIGEITTSKTGKDKAKKGTDDYIALKISEKGQELWSESVGSDGEDILRTVIETRDGGYVFAGTSNPQAVPFTSQGNDTGKGLNSLMPSGGQNAAAQDMKNDINQEIANTSNQVNDTIKNAVSDATGSVNEGLGLGKDSPLKLGANDAASPLSLGGITDAKTGNSPSQGAGNSKPLPQSGDKKKSFGKNDFWVVKLKDKDKPKKDKPTIEAYPNPSQAFTNVIVGYDYQSGTATLVDMGGRILQQFELSGSRTVPVDLSGYPEGIYVINIKTNVQSDGVKVIKGITKN